MAQGTDSTKTAAVAALHPPHGIQQHHGIAPDRDERKAPRGQQVIPGRGLAAARAVRLGAAARAHLDLDGIGGLDQPHSGVDEARKVVAGIEQPGEQHDQLPWQR